MGTRLKTPRRNSLWSRQRHNISVATKTSYKIQSCHISLDGEKSRPREKSKTKTRHLLQDQDSKNRVFRRLQTNRKSRELHHWRRKNEKNLVFFKNMYFLCDTFYKHDWHYETSEYITPHFSTATIFNHVMYAFSFKSVDITGWVYTSHTVSKYCTALASADVLF